LIPKCVGEYGRVESALGFLTICRLTATIWVVPHS